MFYSEKPIISKNEDLLEREKVANDLAKEIESYDKKDSLTIGIVSKWGSGKTSFINMVLENFKENNNYIVIKFNPWNISSRKQLISDFFLQLSNNIEKKTKTNKIVKTIKKSLNKLSKIFKTLESVQFFSILGIIVNFIKECIKTDDKDLETIKMEIDTELEKLAKKLIIVIDDIDRLSDEEIREIFQLVKSIADFKNTIYILSYDREIVIKALNKTQQEKGEEYLEKIIQIPLILPYVSRNELDKIFLDKLAKLVNISDRDDFLYFQELYNNGLDKNFENLRDIERYINVFSFEIKLVKEELNISDYIVITLIKILEPNLYEYIKNNKEINSALIKICDEILNSEKTKNKIIELIKDGNGYDIAKYLGIDTDEYVLKYLETNNFLEHPYIIYYISKKENMEKLVLFIEKNLPLEKLKGLPTNKFNQRTAKDKEFTFLDTMIRNLGNYIGIGENLIICALNSPYVDIRYGAVNTLESWKEKGYILSNEIVKNIKNLEKIEVDDELKEKLNKLVN